jgi:hypothetical protein
MRMPSTTSRSADPHTLKTEIEPVLDVRSRIEDLQFQRSPRVRVA